MVTQGSQNIPTAASGKVLQGAGVGTAPAFSTATYPSTATGTGSILRADGTNFVATTATYPDTAGTSGNVLTSDGTNWSSSAPAGGSSLFGTVGTTSGNPVDDGIYFLVQNSVFSLITTISPRGLYLFPFACTITKVYGIFNIAGTLGTAQNCTLYLRQNDTTDHTISSTIQLTSASVSVTNTGLSISMSAGDFLCWKFVSPTWTTNPTVLSFQGVFST